MCLTDDMLKEAGIVNGMHRMMLLNRRNELLQTPAPPGSPSIPARRSSGSMMARLPSTQGSGNWVRTEPPLQRKRASKLAEPPDKSQRAAWEAHPQPHTAVQAPDSRFQTLHSHFRYSLGGARPEHCQAGCCGRICPGTASHHVQVSSCAARTHQSRGLPAFKFLPALPADKLTHSATVPSA